MYTTRSDFRSAFPHGVEKVEFGSGANPEPGYIHVDLQSKLPDLDIKADVRHVPIPDNFVYLEVRAVHILEHFCHPEYSSPAMRKEWGTTLEVLKEAYRILKPGGRLRIVTPDFDKICASRAANRVSPYWLQRWTVGGHENNYDVHHWLWTHEDAKKWFTEVGFRNLRDWNPVQEDQAHTLNWNTKDVPGNMEWHKIEWYHWLFFEGIK